MSSATVYSPGTCGELVQGLSDEGYFLVSCPIDRGARVTVTLEPDGGEVATPPDYPKAARALRLGLSYLALHGLRAILQVDSALPRSKGMGSSTADVAGALYALGLAAGRPMAPAEVARLALAVEPTNSSLFPDLALLDHREGRRQEYLGATPAAAVLVLDCGGEVDTLAFNSVDRTALLKRLAPQTAEALALVRAGLERGDLPLLARGATLSALAHQAILPKAQLPAVLSAAEDAGALGVCVAHSGTVLGVLFHPERWGEAATASRLGAVAGAAVLGWHRMIGGGFYRQPLGAVAAGVKSA